MSLAHGTCHAGLQIAKTLGLLTELPEKIVQPTKQFCEQLTSKFKRLKINECIGAKMFSVGNYSRDKNVPSDLVFSRLWKNNMLYVAQNYTAGSKVSYYVKYVNNSSLHFGRVKEFRKTRTCVCETVCNCPGDFTAVIQKLQCAKAFSIEIAPGHHVDVPHIYRYTVKDGMDVINPNNLVSVCVNSSSELLCEPLNRFELM